MAQTMLQRGMFQFAATIRRLVRDTSGNELMEAAAIFPLLFMVILGIFWFGQAFSMYGTITRAAQEGARAGAAPYCTTCNTANSPSQNAYNAVQATMSIAKLNIANALPPSTPPSLTQCSTIGGAALCDPAPGIGTNICVQQPVQLNAPSSGDAAVCGISVSFQYPYQFWLPFSTLNKQRIWLKAQARVRIETQ